MTRMLSYLCDQNWTTKTLLHGPATPLAERARMGAAIFWQVTGHADLVCKPAGSSLRPVVKNDNVAQFQIHSNVSWRFTKSKQNHRVLDYKLSLLKKQILFNLSATNHDQPRSWSQIIVTVECQCQCYWLSLSCSVTDLTFWNLALKFRLHT